MSHRIGLAVKLVVGSVFAGPSADPHRHCIDRIAVASKTKNIFFQLISGYPKNVRQFSGQPLWTEKPGERAKICANFLGESRPAKTTINAVPGGDRGSAPLPGP
jgi:hypothetical protein